MVGKQKTIKVSAPGKVILSGEHSVVYGYPAILSAVDQRLKLSLVQDREELKIISDYPPDLAEYGIRKLSKELKISSSKGWIARILSNIPVTGGMGSSAALSVAIAASLYFSTKNEWDLEEINRLAYQIEERQHGRPSGGDNTVSAYGGFLWYRKECESLKTFSNLIPSKKMRVLVIDSGNPEESTGEMVEKVRLLMSSKPRLVKNVFGKMERLSRNFLQLLLGEKSYDLGNLMNENELLLEKIGVVSSKTEQLIKKIRVLGGGAKISGAGGWKNGSGIVLAYHEDMNKLLDFVTKNKLKYFRVKLGSEGVKIEKN